MLKILKSKKNILILILLFLVFFSLNTKWLWEKMYPIQYDEEINKFTNQFDLDPYLVLSIIQVETKFNKDKISKKGATGLMQIMPDTADWIIERGNFPSYFVYQLNKPEINIELGSWYLANVYNNFNRNLIITIAAYNAGPGNVKKWIDNHLWDGSYEHIEQIPYGETRHYIERVLFFYDRYKWIYPYKFT